MAGPSTVHLIVLSTVQLILSLGLTAASIWFFTEVYNVTSLRNPVQNQLDFNVYWPQAIPWMFMLPAIFCLCVSCCGFVGAKRRSTTMMRVFITCEVISVIVLIIAIAVSLALGDTMRTNEFIKNAFWDAFSNIRSGYNPTLEQYFGVIEKRLQCCGSDEPRDYVNWKPKFPVSCCDTYYHGWIGSYAIDCDFTSEVANQRLGCSKVAATYARIFIRVLAGFAALTALVGIANIVIAVAMSKDNKKKNRPVRQDPDTKKVLL